jgi:hypothetical protein
VAHPTDSSTMSLRLFSHVTNLPDNRISNVTRKKIRGELPRTPLLGTWVNKGMREGRSWCAPAFVMKTSVTTSTAGPLSSPSLWSIGAFISPFFPGT